MEYNEIFGDLIVLAKQNKFDVIAHGCNCFCTMGAGIAPKMAKAFGCDKFMYEGESYRGDIIKLGNIDFELKIIKDGQVKHAKALDKSGNDLIVINCYTQFGFGSNHPEGTSTPLDYEALTLCMRKINFRFKGHHIGLPMIGAGLAGGDWNIVKEIIKKELKDCKVTIVIYKKYE